MGESEYIEKKELVISLPGRELKLYVAADIEALITDINDEDKVPCWADVWPAAYGLAHYIWETIDFLTDEKVLELGAGMGLPGIVCGLKGAKLTLSDFNPIALEMAGNNARINGLDAELLQEDWRKFACQDKFDCILASDILYDPKLNFYLGKIFSNNLKPGGKILISHPGRKATYEFLDKWLDNNLFREEKHLREIELKDALLPRYNIVIHNISFPLHIC
ncbi:MAG: methyltransferase domain-containing protein [Firmicutes bacterium]|jgi:predicted nicotinamide N-methyase|nr:methyltransferase domain-containing protein [Bacillota bacterium]